MITITTSVVSKAVRLRTQSGIGGKGCSKAGSGSCKVSFKLLVIPNCLAKLRDSIFRLKKYPDSYVRSR